MARRRATIALAVVLTTALAACANNNAPPAAQPTESPSGVATPIGDTEAAPTPTPPPAPAAVPSDGRPRAARLTIPALDIRNLPIEPYRGWTDDAPGTAIQDRGKAASPYGPRGGVGPGGIGNYQVTAHRTSSTRVFEFLPDLEPGDQVHVDAGGVRYVYEIRTTRRTSFRSERSLAEQRAAVPGRPGVEPTEAFITLSTCATAEDRAAGNFWHDEFGNFEHRIDKIGLLIRTHTMG